MQETTLVIPLRKNQILLGFKKRGFGAGRWNGFGGKIEDNETVAAAAARELAEESLIDRATLSKHGVMDFTFADGIPAIRMHVFRADTDREPKETEEMRPQWFHLDEIPFAEMWPADRYWYPLFLRGQFFRATFHLSNEKESRIIDRHIEVVSSRML